MTRVNGLSRRRALVLLAVAALAGGCSVTVVAPGAAAPGDDTAGWTRAANYTTCDQWLGEMTQPQREAMVRPILERLRQMVDTTATSGAEMAPAYAAAISATCQTPEIQAYDEYFVTAAAAIAFDKRFEP